MKSMEDARWRSLMADEGLTLTEDELKEGWHFCHEWDGLLVGPGMKEGEVCRCFEEHDQRRISVRG